MCAGDEGRPACPAPAAPAAHRIRTVNSQLFRRALAIQAVSAGVPFLVLLALPLPDDFFATWGWVVGPGVFLLAALVNSRLLPAPLSLVTFSALAGLVAGTLVMLVAGHTAGGIVALLVFSASVAGYDGGEQAKPAGAAADERRAA